MAALTAPPGPVLAIDLAMSTLTVAPERLQEVAGVYQNLFGYSVLDSGTLDSGLANSYGIAGARDQIVVGVPGDSRGRIRFLAGRTASPKPLGTFGWNSLELTVADVNALEHEVATRPEFRINGEAHDLTFSGSSGPARLRAMQAVGPAGEQLYMTQVFHQEAGNELAVPPAGAKVGPCFINVLMVRPEQFDPAVAFYQNVLGMWIHLDAMISLSVANAENGWGPEVKTRLGALRPQGGTRIELDGFPPMAEARERPSGDLPAGVGLSSWYVDDFDEVLRRAAEAGALPSTEPVRVASHPYDGRRAAVITGAGGELIEIIG